MSVDVKDAVDEDKVRRRAPQNDEAYNEYVQISRCDEAASIAYIMRDLTVRSLQV